MEGPDQRWPGMPTDSFAEGFGPNVPDTTLTCPHCGVVAAARVNYLGECVKCGVKVEEAGESNVPESASEPGNDVDWLMWLAKTVWRDGYHCRIPERVELIAEQYGAYRDNQQHKAWLELVLGHEKEIRRLRRLLRIAYTHIGEDEWHRLRHEYTQTLKPGEEGIY